MSYVLLFAICNAPLLVLKKKGYAAYVAFLFLFFSALAHVSHIKTALRGEPLTILDYKLISEATNISELLTVDYYTPFFWIAGVFVAFILLILFMKNEPLQKIHRYAFSGTSAAVLLFSYIASVDTLAKFQIDIPADTLWNHEENGFVLASLIDSKFLKVPKPDGYSKERIREIYDKMIVLEQKEPSKKETKKQTQPNVVFVMSESFWDPQFAPTLQTNQDVIPNFRALQKEGIAGKLEVPGIGGGTANTEYEVLTGLSKDFIENYSVPYNPYNNYINRPVHSLAHTFAEEGYDTTAMHTYQSWFYKRDKVYEQLGFHRFISLEYLGNSPEVDGMHTSDKEMTELIRHKLESSEKPNFIYAVTMQGHGPYDELEPSRNDISVKNPLSPPAKTVVEHYLNNTKSIDEEIGRLKEMLEEIEEPTVLVLFGDHIPPLGNDVYDEIGFDTTKPAGKQTPFVIWSNQSKWEGDMTLKTHLLGSVLLDKLHMNQDLYMNHLLRYQQGHVTKEDFIQLQYDIMHGDQYFYEFAGRPKTDPAYRVGEPLHIDHVIARETEDVYLLDLVGSGFTWMTELSLNGNTYPVRSIEGKRAVVSIPQKDLDEQENVTLQMHLPDTRGVVLESSNKLTTDHFSDLLAMDPSSFWKKKKLSGKRTWEVFDNTRPDFTIVRTDLGVKQASYYVTNEDIQMTERKADDMNAGNQVDLYENGYLYLTIPRSKSEWSIEQLLDSEVNDYFDNQTYCLFISEEQQKAR